MVCCGWFEVYKLNKSGAIAAPWGTSVHMTDISIISESKRILQFLSSMYLNMR